MTTLVENVNDMAAVRGLSYRRRSSVMDDCVLGEAIIDLDCFLSNESETGSGSDCFSDLPPFSDCSGSSTPVFSEERPGSPLTEQFFAESPILLESADFMAPAPCQFQPTFNDAMPAAFEVQDHEASLVDVNRIAVADPFVAPLATFAVVNTMPEPASPSMGTSASTGSSASAKPRPSASQKLKKRMQRRWGKRIKYQDRKVQAENQHRVRGRFAKLPPEVVEQRRLAKEAEKLAKLQAKQQAAQLAGR